MSRGQVDLDRLWLSRDQRNVVGRLAAEWVVIEEQEAQTDLEREKVLGAQWAHSGSRLGPVAGPEEIPSLFVGTLDKPIPAILNVADYERESSAVIEMKAYTSAKRLRSETGYSTEPTPLAAEPLRGKNPWRPRIATGRNQTGFH